MTSIEKAFLSLATLTSKEADQAIEELFLNLEKNSQQNLQELRMFFQMQKELDSELIQSTFQSTNGAIDLDLHAHEAKTRVHRASLQHEHKKIMGEIELGKLQDRQKADIERRRIEIEQQHHLTLEKLKSIEASNKSAENQHDKQPSVRQ